MHVCQRWQQIIFTSPHHRLNLQILCTYGTPVRKSLSIWPPFPIALKHAYFYPECPIASDNEDNVIAALEHPDLGCYLSLTITGSQLGKIAMVMQEPFPVLTDLKLSSFCWNALALPTELLGGSAPCLKTIDLWGVPFPALPTLLLSCQ